MSETETKTTEGPLRYNVQAMRFEAATAVARSLVTNPKIFEVEMFVSKMASTITDHLWNHYKMNETIAAEELRTKQKAADEKMAMALVAQEKQKLTQKKGMEIAKG